MALRFGLVVLRGSRHSAERRRRHGRRHAAPGRSHIGLARVCRARSEFGAGPSRAIRHGANRQILVTTGRFGFRTYDVSDPDVAAAAGHVPARRHPRRERLLAGRGHGPRRAAQPDRRRARPAPRRRRPDCLPRHGHLLEEPGLPLGLLRHLVRRPENLRQVGDLVELPAGHTASCIENCNYVWTGGPARRNDLTYLGPFTPRGLGTGAQYGSVLSATPPGRACRLGAGHHRLHDRGIVGVARGEIGVRVCRRCP